MSSAELEFPLLKLDQKVLQTVLQYMDGTELFCLSWISERSKRFVKGILRAKQIRLELGAGLPTVAISFYNMPSMNWTYSELNPADSGIFALQHSEHTTLQRQDFHYRKTVEHFLEILDMRKIDELKLRDAVLGTEPESFFELIRDFDITGLYLYSVSSVRFAKFFLNLAGSFKEIFLKGNPLESTEVLQSKMSGNLEGFRFLPSLEYKLDDIMVLNCRVLAFYWLGNANSLLNKFFKLWIRGGSRRLEYIGIVARHNFDRNEIFRKLNYQLIDDSRQRVFPHNFASHVLFPKTVIYGGCDIRSRDGRLATVRFFNELYLEIFFWN